MESRPSEAGRSRNRHNGVLVTGASGFVAQTLIPALALAGFGVRGAVRDETLLPSGAAPALVNDIGPETDWSTALDGIHAVVHLAARVHIMCDDAADPIGAFRRVNEEGTAALAWQAAAAGVRRFIFMSTIKVNGEATPHRPFLELDQPAPIDPYGISKWKAEQRLFEIAQQTGLQVVVLRPPMVYGPGVRANFLRLMKAVERGIPIPVGWAARPSRRSYISSANLTDFVVRCLDHTRAAGQTFLVSDGQDLALQELVRLIAKEMGRSARVLPLPPVLLKMAGAAFGKTQEVQRLLEPLQVANSHACATLEWQPRFGVEEAVAETVQAYLNQHR